MSFSSRIDPGVGVFAAEQSVDASALQDLLAPFAIESAAANHLAQHLEVIQYELGDGIFDNAQLRSDEPIYLISRGRVRLLSFDPAGKRSVSVLVLESGEFFGGDARWSSAQTLTYSAIAASDVEVVAISPAQLPMWFDQVPNLEAHLQTLTQKRQQLIFFKTQTELRGYPSHILQELLPALLERRITAGISLAQATPSNEGRYWLQTGKIAGVETSTRGESWGYPDAVDSTWVAQTELMVYQLSPEEWHRVSHLPPAAAKTTEFRRSLGLLPVQTPKPRDQAQNRRARICDLPTSNIKDQGSAEPTILHFPKPRKNKRLQGFWKRYPLVEQQSSSDCGVACLAMISRYWGKYFGINSLRKIANVGREGTSLKGLTKSAEFLGYQARPIRASIGRLEEQKHPWIAHWQGNHYVVVYWIRGKRVLVADPALGKRVLPRDDFLDHWTGYGLLLDPTERLYETPNEKRSLTQFVNLLWPYRFIGLQIILASILIQIFGLVSPLFTQIIIDQIVVTKNQTTLNVFILGAFLFGIWGMALGSVRTYLLAYFSNRLDLTMVGGFIQHALSLPLRFFETRRVGDIITRVQENQKIQRFLIGQVMLSWLNFVTGFIYLGLMLYYNWRLTLLVLCLIPPIVIMTLIATPLLRKLSRENFKAAADQNSSLVEMMTGVGTIKAVAAEQELRWRWEDLLTQQLNIRFKGQKLVINIGVINGLVNSIGGTLLMWYGASLVIQDQLTIGQYVAFNMMKGYIISPVLALADLWDELQEIFISVERLNDVFETEPEEKPQEPLLVLASVQGNVRFDNVTFRYSEEAETNTLQNLSFEVKAGETIAIVGRSGSGKSTLVKLIQGLYHPTQGRIWVDDHDVRHLSPPSLRSRMGVVPQECFLFSGTIAENIALYREEYTLEDVVEAAKLAEAHAFIQSFPLGYNTKVGERGSSLSGGQRQRVAIARALLGYPPILILDEATSSLDTESERRFQQNLEQVRRGRTTFIIAHRLSTVRYADRILVLDRGVLIEQGNHSELMAAKQLYYHLAHQQLDL